MIQRIWKIIYNNWITKAVVLPFIRCIIPLIYIIYIQFPHEEFACSFDMRCTQIIADMVPWISISFNMSIWAVDFWIHHLQFNSLLQQDIKVRQLKVDISSYTVIWRDVEREQIDSRVEQARRRLITTEIIGIVNLLVLLYSLMHY